MLAVGLELLVVAASILLVAYCVSLRIWFHPFGRVASRVETNERLVALTFDDGPTDLGVDAILPALASAGVCATFYVNGVHLDAHPDLGRRIVAAGHELGNHGYNHRPLVFVGPGVMRREIDNGERAIRAVGYSGFVSFRPPYGRTLVGLPLYLARRNRTMVMWDVAPDLRSSTHAPERIVADALSVTRPGSILLLHAMFAPNETTRVALPVLLAALRARGYRFVTVSQLLARGRPVRLRLRVGRPHPAGAA